MKRLYYYDGPVVMFGRLIEENWKGATWAETPARAKSNLIFQYKKQNTLGLRVKIDLTEKVMEA